MKKLLALFLVLITLLGTAVIPAVAEDVMDDNVNYIVVEEVVEDAGERIVGKDNRVKIKKTTAFPYRCIAKLRMKFPCCGGWFVGTGTMVSKNKMLTAGHCVYCREHRKWATDIEYYFGYNSRTGKSYKVYKGDSRPWSNYGNDGDQDYAIIVFPTNIGSKTGYMKPLWSKSKSYYTKNTFRVAGYPGGINLSYCKGKVKVVDGNHIKYQMDTEGGQSGGPVYNSSNQIVAIHHSWMGSWNYAHRLSSRVKKLYNQATYYRCFK